jgi:dipeptidyl aminopeptidase/acylaminoacyl peptidase
MSINSKFNGIWRRRSVIGVIGAVLAVAAAHAATPLPVEAFARPAEFRSISFSPDGKRFAAIVEREGRYMLTVVDPKTFKGKSFSVDRGRDVESYRWLSNDLVEIRSNRAGVRVFDLERRDFETHYLSIDGRSRFSPLNGGAVLYRVPRADNQVVVETMRGRSSVKLEVFDTDANDRKGVLMESPPVPDVADWILDDKLVPQAGVGYSAETDQVDTWIRDPASGRWTKPFTYDMSKERGYYPAAIDALGEPLVLSNQQTGRYALYRYDRAAKRVGELLVGDAGFDIGQGDLIRADSSRAPIGVTIDAERPQTYWFDAQRAAEQRVIDASLPAGRVNALQKLPDGKLLVRSYSDTEPGVYYFYDPQEKTLSEWLSTRPWIDATKMSRTEVVRYRSRDGQDLMGYFTRPFDARPGPVPLLVWVHGGPAGRDHWGFDAEVQFFASRGYAVFQPYFRGSTGMGDTFEAAGYRQWGLRMQDDVTDGVRALVERKQVDPQRICIGGGSYGGYAALMGVIREPAMFRCAIDEAGPTDLIRFIESAEADYNRRTHTAADSNVEDGLRRRIGDLRDPVQRRQLEETSPRRLAAQIKVPVLLMYGTEDWRVPLEHGIGMRDALQAAGARYEWKSYDGEGHGVWGSKNRVDRLQRLERFLAQHLGAAATAP